MSQASRSASGSWRVAPIHDLVASSSLTGCYWSIKMLPCYEHDNVMNKSLVKVVHGFSIEGSLSGIERRIGGQHGAPAIISLRFPSVDRTPFQAYAQAILSARPSS